MKQFSLQELEALSLKHGISYNTGVSYEENYAHGPYCNLSRGELEELREYGFFLDSKLPKKRVLGFEANSNMGVPAGPLLNSKFILHYSALGFDLCVYKTVRSEERKVHPFPNVVPLGLSRQLKESEVGGEAVSKHSFPGGVSITNSFGMPSKTIEAWQQDFRECKLKPGQLRMISVVGTPRTHSSLELAEDFAFLAGKAFEAGAQVVELNYSCPNVSGREGSLYCDSRNAGLISKTVRERVGSGKRVLAKLGYYRDKKQLSESVEAITSHLDGVSAINTIPMKVRDEEGKQALPGEGRLVSGVCGEPIRSLALETVSLLSREREKLGRDFTIVGVGGVTKPEHYFEFIERGVDAVQSATGAMWDPLLALKIKKKLVEG